MTMSERTITVTLTGPQYRELAAAVALASNEWEQDRTGHTSQSHRTLDRAWEKIADAWDRNDAPQMPESIRPSVQKLREHAFPSSPNTR